MPFYFRISKDGDEDNKVLFTFKGGVLEFESLVAKYESGELAEEMSKILGIPIKVHEPVYQEESEKE